MLTHTICIYIVMNSKSTADALLKYSPCLFALPGIPNHNLNSRLLHHRSYGTMIEPDDIIDRSNTKLSNVHVKTPKEIAEQDIAKKNARLTSVIEYIRLMITSDKPIILEDIRVIKLLQLINEAQIDKNDRSHTGPGKYPDRNSSYKDKEEVREKSNSMRGEEPCGTSMRTIASAWGRPSSRNLSTGNMIHFRTFCCKSFISN